MLRTLLMPGKGKYHTLLPKLQYMKSEWGLKITFENFTTRLRCSRLCTFCKHYLSERDGTDVYATSLCSCLIPPLHQQVARTLGEEGQHTQLQHRWHCQEGKQVVPPGHLQSKHQQKDSRASDIDKLKCPPTFVLFPILPVCTTVFHWLIVPMYQSLCFPLSLCQYVCFRPVPCSSCVSEPFS